MSLQYNIIIKNAVDPKLRKSLPLELKIYKTNHREADLIFLKPMNNTR